MRSKKVTMLNQGPKWHRELNSMKKKKKKRLELAIKKKRW